MRRLVAPLSLAAVDVLLLVACTAIAVILRAGFSSALGIAPFEPVRDYYSLWPALVIFVLVRSGFSLYPGYGLNPAEELRRLTLSSLLVIAVFTVGGTLFRFAQDYSRLVLALSALAMLVVLPSARAAVKRGLSSASIWGEATWILGNSDRARQLARLVDKRPDLGLCLVGIGEQPPEDAGRIKHCIVIPEDFGAEPLPRLLDRLNRRFKRVWLVPNLLDVASVWVTPRDLDGHLALELRNNLLEPTNKWIKRGSELLILALAAPFVVPVLLVLSIVVAADRPGPILFRQRRVGHGGQCFEMLKFRTMRADAEHSLQHYLSFNPEAREEWLRTQKLRHDPRLTRAGRFLRRYSLDELPQLWNVLCGQMSLVGPRAITEPELCNYGDKTELYTSVVPGITGLWQVSGRSGLSYAERVRLDAYYVRNWSIWLDLSVLSKTPSAVFSTRGAY